MRNYHENDDRPAEYEEFERHASDCGCDYHVSGYDFSDRFPEPTEAEIEDRVRRTYPRSA